MPRYSDEIQPPQAANGQESILQLRKLLAEIGAQFGVKAQERGLFFEIFLDPDVPRFFQCDEKNFRKLLSLLLHASINRLNSGGVVLHVHLRSLGSDHYRAEISITEQKKNNDDSLELPTPGTHELPEIIMVQVKNLARHLGGDLFIRHVGANLNRYCLFLPLGSLLELPFSHAKNGLPAEKNPLFSDIIGVFYVSNLPQEFSQEQTRRYFMGMKNILSVSVYDNHGDDPAAQGCWLELKQPYATALTNLKNTFLEGRKLHITFMGHLIKNVEIHSH